MTKPSNQREYDKRFSNLYFEKMRNRHDGYHCRGEVIAQINEEFFGAEALCKNCKGSSNDYDDTEGMCRKCSYTGLKKPSLLKDLPW